MTSQMPALKPFARPRKNIVVSSFYKAVTKTAKATFYSFCNSFKDWISYMCTEVLTLSYMFQISGDNLCMGY
jgi:hypothetical protein